MMDVDYTGAHETVAAGQLRAFIERIERIESDIKDMNADKSEIYKEARGFGFDVKAIRQCVASRKLDGSELAERNAIFDLYWGALTGGSHVHVHEEANWGPDVGREILAPYEPAESEPVIPGPSSLAAHEADESAAPIPSDDVPAFLLRERKPLRAHCLNPDLCAGSGREHCHACTKAMAESEAA